MNKRKIIIRLIVSPFILGMLISIYIFYCLKHWVKFIRYGGEWITYEKDDFKTIKEIFELLKEQN